MYLTHQLRHLYQTNMKNNHLYNRRKLSLEEKLDMYTNRMELVRTVIGIVVLGIQIVILHHLLA